MIHLSPTWLVPMILAWGQGLITQTARANEDYAETKGLPPSWEGPAAGLTPGVGDPFSGDPGYRPQGRPEPSAQSRLNKRPWYLPRASLGLSTNSPEIFAVESHVNFGRYFGLRLFYAPPLTANVRVEMPSDLILVKSNVALANPAFNINGKLTYGEHYGAEALAFPFGGSFFLMGGASHRKIRLVADAQSPLLICSGSAILATSPCSDAAATIQSQIKLKAHADVITEATLLRAGMGWYWHIGSFGYFSLNLGAAKPTAIKRNASLAAAIVAPSGDDAELNAALEQMRSNKLGDLRRQTLNATKPVDLQVLPILGVGAGVRF